MRPTDLAETPSPTRRVHKRYLPWQLLRDDCYHPIAYTLRTWSRVEQYGDTVNRPQMNSYENLRRYLLERDAVVAYSREEGFTIVPRDPTLDDPKLPIRRPPDY